MAELEATEDTPLTIEDKGTPAAFPWQHVIVCATILVLVFKLVLALRTYGTNDVYAYERFYFGTRALGVQFYKTAWDFNHPPSMFHILRLIGWLSQATPLPFQFWLRLPGIVADAGSVFLVWKLMRRRLFASSVAVRRSTALALLFLAVAPVSIMVSGFHGNDDGVLIFFVLFSVWLAERESPAWLAGAAFGLSMCFKISPIIVAPALLFYQPGLRRRMQFLASAVAVPLIAWQPYLLQDPRQIWNSVFGYRSLSGIWGLSYLTAHLAAWSSSLAWMNTFWVANGPWLTLGVCTAVAFYMNLVQKKKPRLYAQVGLLFFLFMALSSGFGVQYLLWLAPWVVELGAGPAAIYFLFSGVFLFSVYNFWCQGMSWYLADSNQIGPWGGYMDLLQLLTWLSVLLLAYLAWKRIRLNATQSEVAVQANAQANFEDGSNFWIVLGATALSLIFFASTQWLALQQSGAAVHAALNPAAVEQIRERTAVNLAVTLQQLGRAKEAGVLFEQLQKTSPTHADLAAAQRYFNISLTEYQAGQFQNSLAAARQALSFQPDMAEAYNNMAADYNSLREWDSAIQAAQQAIRLKPGFVLARNNLAWAIAQKQLQH